MKYLNFYLHCIQGLPKNYQTHKWAIAQTLLYRIELKQKPTQKIEN